jgi:Fe-S-cluster-containing hydrogenase component 2
MKPIFEKSVSDIDGANAAKADLGIACERCSQACSRSTGKEQGRSRLPLSQARVQQKLVNWRGREEGVQGYTAAAPQPRGIQAIGAEV